MGIMKEKLRGNLAKMMVIILLSLVGAASIEVIRLLIEILYGYESKIWNAFFVYNLACVSMVLIGLWYIIKKLGFKYNIFIVFLFAGMLFSDIALYYIPKDIYKYDFRYYGIAISEYCSYECRGSEYNNEVCSDVCRETATHLFRNDDARLEQQINEYKKNKYEHVEKVGFLFWETGIVFGFHPVGINVPSWVKSHTRVKLFIAAVFFAIFEAFITGMYKYFLFFLIAQILLSIIVKEPVWWVFKSSNKNT